MPEKRKATAVAPMTIIHRLGRDLTMGAEASSTNRPVATAA